MVSHKVANTFIRKYNNHFQMKGYSKLNIVEKKKLIESKLRSLSSDDVRKARSEWQTLKEGLTTKAHTKPTKASTPSSKTSSEKGAAGVGKIPAKPKSTSSRASTASTETTTPAPPSLRLSIRSSQKDRVSSLVSSKGLSTQNFRPREKKKKSSAGFSDVDRVDVRKVGMVPGGGFTHSDMMYKTKEEKKKELDARIQALNKSSSVSSWDSVSSSSSSAKSSIKSLPSSSDSSRVDQVISESSSSGSGNAPFSHGGSLII